MGFIPGKIINKLSISAKLINAESIEKVLIKAFEQWAKDDINEQHWKEQFIDREWPYDGETKRENPRAFIREADSPRDIYDWGRLYQSGIDSFQLEVNGGLLRASWHWDAKNSSGQEYAWYVHYGKGTNATARPFTDDIAIPSSFFFKDPGLALQRRIFIAIGSL